MPKILARRRGTERPPARTKSELARNAALHVLSLMRTRGLSRARAIRETRTTPKSVMRYAGVALRKNEKSRYEVLPYDKLPRTLNFLTSEGRIAITVRSSKTASKIAEYMTALDRYLKTGDVTPLDRFRGKSVRFGKVKYEFITDSRTLDRLAHAGEVRFEDLYAMST